MKIKIKSKVAPQLVLGSQDLYLAHGRRSDGGDGGGAGQAAELLGRLNHQRVKQTKSGMKRNKQAKLNEQLLCIIYLQSGNMSTKNKYDQTSCKADDSKMPCKLIVGDKNCQR